MAGPQPYALSLADLEELAVAEEQLPFAANEGWSAAAHWRGVRLLDLVQRAGGTAYSQVRVLSLEPRGPFNKSLVEGEQLPRRCWPPISTESGSASTTAIHCD